MNLKSIKLFSVLYLFVFVLFTGTLFAQSTINISGEFEGTRGQFDNSGKRITKEFTYKYELTQKDNIVEGISTIISEAGNYAEVGIRGVVIKNKFYFEEFKMLDQIKAPSMVWCYKSGVLDISTKENEITLSGNTASYMVNYGYACTGGFTRLTNYHFEELVTQKSLIENQNKLDLKLYPVPAKDFTSLSFNLENASEVSFEVLDLSGKVVLVKETTKAIKGIYNEKIDISKFTPGMYILNITIGKATYTKELLKYN